MPTLLEALLPEMRQVASSLAGTPAAHQALQDVTDLEMIAAKDIGSWEGELRQWLTSRLHPATAQPATSAPAEQAKATAQSTAGQATQQPAS